MKLDVVGPLLFWTAMFFIGSLIKFIAFKNNMVWIEAAPEAALWATGILFTLSVSAGNFLERKAIPRMEHDPDGSGFKVKYDIILPENLKPTQRFFYLFLAALVVWILDIFLIGSAIDLHNAAGKFELVSIACISSSFLLTSAIVVIAICSVGETLK